MLILLRSNLDDDDDDDLRAVSRRRVRCEGRLIVVKTCVRAARCCQRDVTEKENAGRVIIHIKTAAAMCGES